MFSPLSMSHYDPKGLHHILPGLPYLAYDFTCLLFPKITPK